MSLSIVNYNNKLANCKYICRLCKLRKGCTRPAAASNKVHQLLVHGRWFSPGTPASSTTKTSRHDIAEILLKVALSTINMFLIQEMIVIAQNDIWLKKENVIISVENVGMI
jgi:hypothetical protein